MKDLRHLQWERRYQEMSADQLFPQPAEVLKENAHLLPSTGRVLDLACGLGGNALFLSQRGLEVYAWDYSERAIASLQTIADKCSLIVHTQVRDVVTQPPSPNSFDVIVVSNFLERGLVAHIIQGLSINGLLFYQTFTQTKVSDQGPKSDQFRLYDNELLSFCKDMHLLVYREEGAVGDYSLGFRNQAYCVAKNR